MFHGNAYPPRRAGFLRSMIELVTSDGPDVVCLQELPVWAVARIAGWSGMHHFEAVTRPPLWPGPLSTWVTRAHQGFFRSGLSGQANAILVAPRHAATDIGHERISDGRGERRIVHAVRIAGTPGVTIGNLHTTNDFAHPEVPGPSRRVRRRSSRRTRHAGTSSCSPATSMSPIRCSSPIPGRSTESTTSSCAALPRRR